MTKTTARWLAVLVALVLAAPFVSAKAVGESSELADYGARRYEVTGVASSWTRAPLQPQAAPAPAPPPRTPAPTPAPQPPAPAPATPAGFCSEPLSLNVIDAELHGVVQAGADLLSEYFGCQKFQLDGSGLPVRFGEITPMFGAKVLGYAYSAPGTYEIWLNPDCWGIVGEWAGVVAHELGHYLGWQHGDTHPYMWLQPPPGSYAQAGDATIVCY